MEKVGAFKFIAIALLAVVLLGLLVGIIRAVIVWNKTGDWKPTADATIGQFVYWDTQIYNSISMLKDEQTMNSIPDSFREQVKDFAIQQIIMFIMLFAIVGYALFKFGNWLAGEAAFEPTTDIIVIAIIILVVFPVSEMGYGYLMYKDLHPPYRGVVELCKPSTWEIMFSDIPINVYGNSSIIQNSTRQTIDLGGG